jgi:hypothetical protein
MRIVEEGGEVGGISAALRDSASEAFKNNVIENAGAQF